MSKDKKKEAPRAKFVGDASVGPEAETAILDAHEAVQKELESSAQSVRDETELRAPVPHEELDRKAVEAPPPSAAAADAESPDGIICRECGADAVSADLIRHAPSCSVHKEQEAAAHQKLATALRLLCRAAVALPPQHPLGQALTAWVMRLTGAEIPARPMSMPDLWDGLAQALPLITAALQGEHDAKCKGAAVDLGKAMEALG